MKKIKLNKATQIGIAAVAIAIAIYAAWPKKAKADTSSSDTPADEGKAGQDPTRPKDDPTLSKKEVYTKKIAVASVDGASVRSEPYVNDGYIHNIFYRHSKGDTVGAVVDVVEDKGKAVRQDGKIWKWFKVLMPVQRSTYWFWGSPKDTSMYGYIREDVVNLK